MGNEMDYGKAEEEERLANLYAPSNKPLQMKQSYGWKKLWKFREDEEKEK